MQHADRAQETLEERYGTKRRAGIDRRIGWSAAILLIIGGIAYVLFSGWEESSRVAFSDIGYTIESDQSVQVRFEVTAPPGSELACAIEALSSSKGTVGWRVLTLEPVETSQQTVQATLTTTQTPVTGSVSQCWVLENE